MKQYIHLVAALFTLLFVSQTYGQIEVNTVGELRRALNNPNGATTITVTSDIIAGADVTAETDMQDDSLITTPPTRNFQYADIDNAMLTGNYIGGKVYWAGGTFAPGYADFIKSDQQAVTGLTLQGSGSGTILGLDNTLHSTKSVGQLLEMDFYENLTLKNLTLTGADLQARYNLSDTNKTIEAYGGTMFNGNTGNLMFENVFVTNNSIKATKQADTTSVGVGAGGMRLIYSENVIFDGTKFANNSAEYSNGAEPSVAGDGNFSAQAGGLYIGTFDTLKYLGTNSEDFVNNKVIASDANVDAGALIIRVDDRAAMADFSNVEFANNSATVNVTADLTSGVAARAGAALILNEGNTEQLIANFTKINVRNNSATVTNVDGKNVQTNSAAIGGGFASAGGNTLNFKDSMFIDNAAIFQKGDGTARGGAIAVSDAVTDSIFGNVIFNVDNTVFTGNTATADTGTAYGGAVSVIKTQGGTTVDSTFIDSSFENNAATGATASGGAIYADTDLITIKAASKDVLFSGNSSNGSADSVYTTKNLTYDVAAGRTITDEDKITVGGDLNVNGQGKADFRTVSVAGNTIVDGATVSIADLENSSTGTSTTLKGNGTLILGDASNKTINNFTKEDGTVQGGIFTAWNYDEAAQTLTATQRENADLNDGFLAVFGIHSRNTVWKAVRDQMISGNGRYQVPQQAYYGQGYYGQELYEQESIPFDATTSYDSMVGNPCEPLAYDPCAPMTTGYSSSISPNVAWATYTGRSDEFRSAYNGKDWQYSMEGVQVGTDLFKTRYAQLGLLFGYESGEGRNDWDRIDAEDTYLGVYAACLLAGGADIRGVFGYGWQDYDMNRWYDNTNLYTSSFKGHTIEGNLEIGKRFASGPWSLRPALGVDVISNEIDGVTEIGNGNAAVRYNDAKMTQLFVRAGTDLRYKVRGFTLNSGIYYAYDVNGEDLSAGVSSIDGVFASQLTGSELGRSMLLFNLGGSLQLTRNLALIGGYQGESILDRDNNGVQSTGYIGGSWKW